MKSIPDWQTCIPCETGREWDTAAKLEKMRPQTHVLVPMQAKHQKRDGVKRIERKILFPGYVFLYAPVPIDKKLLRLVPELCFSGYAALTRSDIQFCTWLLERNGFVDVSFASKENDSVLFLSGPIRDMEEHVVKIDKKRRNALMEIPLCGHEFRLWFAFWWTEEAAAV